MLACSFESYFFLRLGTTVDRLRRARIMKVYNILACTAADVRFRVYGCALFYTAAVESYYS